MELDMTTPKIDRMGTKITIVSNGDIFNTKCEALVNPVNTKGVMGKGLALAFKNTQHTLKTTKELAKMVR